MIISRSVNGGKDWNILSESTPNGYRSAVEFAPDKNLVLCTGTNGTDMSFDNGLTWKNFSKDGFNAICFSPSGKFGYLAGSNIFHELLVLILALMLTACLNKEYFVENLK